MQIQKAKKSNTRLLIAVALFLTSIIASLLIIFLSSSGESYWVSSKAISRGVQISPSDLTLVKITLGRGASGYISSSQNPAGFITRRNLKAGEIINIADLSETLEDLNTESLSLGIRVADIPQGTANGDLVTLYQIFDARNGEEVPAPQLVISDAFIKEISMKSANFGSDAAVTITLRREDVPAVLAATASGRIVIVASHG